MEKIKSFLNFSIEISDNIHLDIKTILFLIFILLITSSLLKLIRKLVNRKLEEEDKGKFKAIFTFLQYFIYIVVSIIALESAGIEVGVLLAGSAALLVGIGLGLQTLFQDIISGIFILVDQSVHVGDIIELEGKVGRVLDIRLRTTRAVTVDNKVLVIPNHLYLTNILYNWTENGTETRESVEVGVAYGSDIDLVKKILIEIASNQPNVLDTPAPIVLFTDFAESSLNFKVAFTLDNSFEARFTQSNIRFEIDKAFREHQISIPFPQRDVHLIK